MSSIYRQPPVPVPAWRAARHRTMLTAAIQVMQGHDSDDISMDEIAQAAGVGKATLYRYFQTKEALLRQCLEGIVEELGTRMEAAEAAAVPPPERLKHIIGLMVDVFSQHLLPLRQLTRHQGELDEEWRQSVQAARRRLAAVLDRHFQRGREQGFYRALDLKLVPHLITGMIRSGVTHATGLSNAAITDGIYDFVLRGTRNGEHTPGSHSVETRL